MTPRRAAALLAAGLAALACGKYGPPVRARDREPVATSAGSAAHPAPSAHSVTGAQSAPAADPADKGPESDTPEARSQENPP